MSSMSLLSGAPQRSTSEVVVVVSGEIDISTAGRLREQLGIAMGSVWTVVVLDASAVTFMDCAGLRELVAARARLLAGGRGLLLRTPSEAVLSLLRWTDTVHLFPVTDHLAPSHLRDAART